MKSSRSLISYMLSIVAPLIAAPAIASSLAIEQFSQTSMEIVPFQTYESAELRITGPKGYSHSQLFEANEPLLADLMSEARLKRAAGLGIGQTPTFESLPNGSYNYEVVFISAIGEKSKLSGAFNAENGMLNPSVLGPVSSIQKSESEPSVGEEDLFEPNFITITDVDADGNTGVNMENSGFSTMSVRNISGVFRVQSGSLATAPSFLSVTSTNGLVGVGVDAPTASFHLTDDPFNVPRIFLEATGSNADWGIWNQPPFGLLFGMGTGTSISPVSMVINESGNVGIGSSSPAVALHVSRGSGNAAEIRSQTSGGAVTPRRNLYLLNNGDPLLRLENTSNGRQWDFRITSGGFSITRVGSGTLEAESRNNGDFAIAGSYLTTSSRTVKDNIVEVDGNTVLAKLESLPIAEWSYSRDLSQRHVGPMAEDFHAAFGLGPDSRHVTPTDLAGVALAAAKALKAENAALKRQNEAILAELAGLRAAIEAINTSN